MSQQSLYVICRNTIESLEAWDANDLPPMIVFGPASWHLCQYYVHHGYGEPDYYILDYEEVAE